MQNFGSQVSETLKPVRRFVSPYLLKTIVMTSSNGNIFRFTGLLCGEITGHYWIPFTKARHSFDVFFDQHLNKQLNKQS